MSSYFNKEELKGIGFRSFGEEVWISRNAIFYTPDKIDIGSHVRIDDFCLISGGEGIKIGNYVHVAAFSLMLGAHGIVIGDFVNISGRVSIYSTSDDYSGEFMTGPLVGKEFIYDIGGRVVLEKHVIVGTGSTILPNVTLREGTAVGAMSLIKSSTEPYTVYAGIPAQKVKARKQEIRKMEEKWSHLIKLGGGDNCIQI